MRAGSAATVIVGAGLAGAATALALAREGREVTIVERSEPANHAGSSHGSARIFRYAYPDPFYTGLVTESRVLWDELERSSGRRLISPTGALDFGEVRRPEALAAVLAEHGVAFELLDPVAARERWPGIAIDTLALWHSAAGVIDAEAAVLTMIDLAVSAGAELLTDWPVARLEDTGRPGARYTVVSERGERIEAESVVVSAGGWLPALLDALALPPAFRAAVPRLTVMQENAFHFPYRDAARATEWPTMIHKRPDIQVYALPGGRDAGFAGQKVAEYNGGRAIGSALDADGVVDPANRERVTAYVARYLPGLVPEPYAETTCLFTNTPDEDFVIDRIDGVTILSPCSGHGAKFAPLLGVLAAELVTASDPSASTVPARFRAASRASRATRATRGLRISRGPRTADEHSPRSSL